MLLGISIVERVLLYAKTSDRVPPIDPGFGGAVQRQWSCEQHLITHTHAHIQPIYRPASAPALTQLSPDLFTRNRRRRADSQWFTRSSSGAASVHLLRNTSAVPCCSNSTQPAKLAFFRHRRPTLATRHRNAPPLQQGVPLGVPHLRGRGRQLRLLADGRRAPTVQGADGSEGCTVGEKKEGGAEGSVEYGHAGAGGGGGH